MAIEQFRELIEDFLLESRERINRVEEILLAMKEVNPSQRQEMLNEVKRELHTLKGNSGMMGFVDVQNYSHTLEDRIGEATPETVRIEDFLVGLDQLRELLAYVDKKEGEEEESGEKSDGQKSTNYVIDIARGGVRVPFETLDTLMDLLSEMVIFRNRHADAISRARNSRFTQEVWDEVEASQEALSKNLTFLQERIMQLRLVPLKSLFGAMRRIVHDEGIKEGKQVQLETLGGETPMDKALLEVANEALGHLIRNAVIHGIEPPEIREQRGKKKAGRIQLMAAARAGEVQIDVRDDGGGIDRNALVESARKKGIDVSSQHDLYELLFLPGLSTRETSDLSAGRGMGLSAALKAVQRMGGRVEVASEEGKGTLFRLRLPLSISIIRALLLSADGEYYALPLTSIVESFHYKHHQSHEINRAGVLRWRKGVIPLLDIGYIFGTHTKIRDEGYTVIIEQDSKYRGIIVDDIQGLREIVVKKLDPVLGSPVGVSGSTILGDGKVVLILDPAGLMAIRPFVEEIA